MITRPRLLLAGMAVALIFVSAYAASAAELELAGIRLGRSAMTIIQKYGNPTEIRIGAAAEQIVSAGQGADSSASQPTPGALPGALPELGSMPGAQPGSSTGALPVITRKGPPEVRWIYRIAANKTLKTLEFIINPDGRIMQISAFASDWPTMKTSKGIAIGASTYKDVLAKYGFPESHDTTGVELITRYTKKDRVIFSLVGNTVVGITIGLMD